MKPPFLFTRTGLALCLLSAGLCILLYACSKGKENEPATPPKTVQLSLSSTTAAPYQFITLQLPDGSQPANNSALSVEVKLGAVTAQAYAPADGLSNNVFLYHLIIPELPVGEHRLSMTIAGGDVAEATLKITGFTTIADPAAYIQSRQAAALQEITNDKATYDAQVLNGYIKQSTADSLKKLIQDAYAENIATVAALSDAERKIYVQLIEANKHWLTAYKQVAIQNPFNNQRGNEEADCEKLRDKQELAYNQGWDWEVNYWRLQADMCESYREKERLVANSAFVKHMESSYAAAKQKKTETNGLFKPYWAFVKTFCSEAVKPITETWKGAKDMADPIAALEVEDAIQEKIMALEFEVEKEYDFGVGINVTNISRENAGLSPDFAQMLQAVDDHNKAMENLGQFFSFTPTIAVPAKKTEKVYISQYTVDQISDSRISIVSTTGGKGSRVKFLVNTAVVQEYIEFSFRVNYTSQYGNVSKVINATLYQPIEKILVKASPWKIINWVEGGVDQFTMHEIWRWKCNNVEYINREQVLEASLSFAVGGIGTSSEKYHEVYYENPNSQICNVQKVDQEKTYGGSFTWSYDKTSKTLTAHFKNDEGEEKDLVTAVTIQNSIVTLSGPGVTLKMQKK